MKTIQFTLLVSLLSCIVFADVQNSAISSQASLLAQQAVGPINPPKAVNKRAAIEQRPEVLKKTGGFLDVQACGIGVLAIDARPTAKGAVEQFATIFSNLSKLLVKVDITPLAESVSPIEFALTRLHDEKAMYVLLIVQNAKLSGLTVLPEERAVIVNASKYLVENDSAKSETRIVKELWRGLGFVSGIGYAPFKNDVFQPVFSLEELDALEYQVMQPMNFQKMYAEMSKRGFKRARHIPYRTAVYEGWASAPTNEYQKAIWNEIKADKERGPAKPITIPPPSKK